MLAAVRCDAGTLSDLGRRLGIRLHAPTDSVAYYRFRPSPAAEAGFAICSAAVVPLRLSLPSLYTSHRQVHFEQQRFVSRIVFDFLIHHTFDVR